MNDLERETMTELRNALLDAKSWVEELYSAHVGDTAAQLVQGSGRRMHPIIGAINRGNAVIEANS